MKFCSNCGARVQKRVPEGDHLERAVCDECGRIHYSNPNVVVGTIPEWEGDILLCKRAIEPRLGKWTLPAGFLEHHETTSEAGARETREEACAEIEIGELFSLMNVPHIGQVHMFYRAKLIDGEFAPGQESSEACLFAEAEIPWRQLAFPTVYLTLQFYFEDRRNNSFELHLEDIEKPLDRWRDELDP